MNKEKAKTRGKKERGRKVKPEASQKMMTSIQNK